MSGQRARCALLVLKALDSTASMALGEPCIDGIYEQKKYDRQLEHGADG